MVISGCVISQVLSRLWRSISLCPCGLKCKRCSSLQNRIVSSGGGLPTDITPPPLHKGRFSMARAASSVRKTRAHPRCKFFLWLTLLDRCWMSERLHRHQLLDNDHYIICAQAIESIQHLLLNCVFSREVWFNVLRWSGLHRLAPSSEDRCQTGGYRSISGFTRSLSWLRFPT
jgi:hypothetical protein